MNLTSFVPTIAKAVAAFMTPLVLLALGWLAERTGVDVPDSEAVQAAIIAVVTALVTWAIRNRPVEPTPPGE